MNIIHNQLPTIRKKNHLQLKDVAKLIGIDPGNLSRQESGASSPTVATILGYSILFDQPLNILFKDSFTFMSDTLIDNATLLKEELQGHSNAKSGYRLASLEKIMNRLLVNQISYEYEA
ncbi:MAG: helix-turn-helix transcriptional regulator [Bacteroidia bacterium]|nr:helix-turn-helix transcriptional regulator [Bacteroidia bacterium]